MSLRASSHIRFHYQTRSFSFPRRNPLKSFLISLFSKEKRQLSDLSIVFCTDAYLLEINKTHLKHDFYTDIVTFSLSLPGEPIAGEMYISVERVRENAEIFESTFLSELHRVIFHGCLHLCGYLDKSKPSKELMRRKEDFYLDKYFVSRGTSS